MTDSARDEAAVAAIARAIRRAWPTRMVEKFAPGWSAMFLVALRTDPEVRDAVVAALLDEETLARALEQAGAVDRQPRDAGTLARQVLGVLGGSTVKRS
jgi:hypothetical protein